MANTLSIDQINTLLRAVLSQSTGRSDLAALDTGALLTIGQNAIATAPDPVLKSISQVLTKTIFSSRPYTAKFKELRTDPAAWGNIVRKLKIIDKEGDVDETGAYDLVEGSAVDQYKVDDTKVVELNFVGQQTYTITKTIFETQFNTCFNSADEFSRFIGMIFTYVNNKIEKIHEDTARGAVAAFAGGIIQDPASAAAGRVIHLLTEYNAETGLALDGTSVYLPANFPGFVRWMFARLEDVSALMTEYSKMFQTALTKGGIDQHTPADKQIGFFYAPFFRHAATEVLSTTFHDQMLKIMPRAEMVNFWQSIKTPGSINLSHANYLAADGTITDGGALTNDVLFGVIMDDEAVGYSPILKKMATTPYNARGEYWNYYWHFNERHWADFTEKAVVLLLD